MMFASDAIAQKHYAASIFLCARIARDHRGNMHRRSRERLAEALRGL
ncbi:hypothetical protein QRQ56_04140 [Bradyrhizobium sp. U531]